MAKEFEITDEMRAQIGQESPPWPIEVTTTQVRMFARGVGYTDPVYFDEEAAQKAGYRSLPVPPTHLGIPVFIPGQCSNTFSGPSEGQPSISHGLPGLLDGGTETEYLEQICAGDKLTMTTKLAGLDVRESPALGKMLIVTSESVYKNENGDPVAIQRAQAIFY